MTNPYELQQFAVSQYPCEEVENIANLLATITRIESCSIVVKEERMSLCLLVKFAANKSKEYETKAGQSRCEIKRRALFQAARKWEKIEVAINDVIEFNRKFNQPVIL